MIIETEIPFGNEPNKNGRIYPKEVVKKMCNDINQGNKKFVSMGIPESASIDLSKTCGHIESASYNEQNNSLIIKCDVKKLLGESEKEFNKYFSIVPSGVGNLKDGIVQDDFTLISFSVIPKQDSSFEYIKEIKND